MSFSKDWLNVPGIMNNLKSLSAGYSEQAHPLMYIVFMIAARVFILGDFFTFALHFVFPLQMYKYVKIKEIVTRWTYRIAAYRSYGILSKIQG